VLAAEEDGPGDAAGVLALQEERLGLAVLEAEDLAVATDVDFTLYQHQVTRSVICSSVYPQGVRSFFQFSSQSRGHRHPTHRH
jgi:hypothetical protein